MYIKELYKYADIEITGSDANKTYAAVVEAWKGKNKVAKEAGFPYLPTV